MRTASRAGISGISCTPRPARLADHRRQEFVKREDRRRGEPGQHGHRFPLVRRQADRLARLERHAVHDDPRSSQLAHDRVGNVPRSLARPAGEHQHIAILQRRGDASRSRVGSSRTMPSTRGTAPSSRTASARIRAFESNTCPGRIRLPGSRISSPVERIPTVGCRKTSTAARPIAASTPVSRLVSSSPRRSTVSVAAISVPANVTPEPGRHGSADQQLPSIESVSSIMTTLSAPRGNMAPVAMATAVPGVTSALRGRPPWRSSHRAIGAFGDPLRVAP